MPHAIKRAALVLLFQFAFVPEFWQSSATAFASFFVRLANPSISLGLYAEFSLLQSLLVELLLLLQLCGAYVSIANTTPFRRSPRSRNKELKLSASSGLSHLSFLWLSSWHGFQEGL